MIPILRASDAGELKRRVMNRSQLQNEEVSRIVKEIVARVRQEGDAALFDYTAKFDHVTMKSPALTPPLPPNGSTPCAKPPVASLPSTRSRSRTHG